MLDLLSSLILGDKPEKRNEKPFEVVGTFEFFLEPCVQGFIGLHTSTIVMTVFEDETRQRPLPFSVKWSKIMNSETFELESYNEPFYHVTPSDIDLKIRAAVTSTDPRYPGVAYFYVGPIAMDKAVVPEIEGLVLNQSCSYKVQVLSLDGVSLPHNSSRVSVRRPLVTLTFDPDLEDMQTTELNPARAFLPLEINFEQEGALKVRTDNTSVTSVSMSYLEANSPDRKLKFRFDSRFERDAFYIFLRLARSIKQTFVEKMLSEYDSLVSAHWSIINIELDEEEDETIGIPGYEMLLSHDLVRERLRSMVRINRELTEENGVMVDTIDVLEKHLFKTITNFRTLVSLSKKWDERSLNNLEAANKSVMAETSMVLDDIKKSKKKRDIDASAIQQEDEKRRLERKVEKLKQSNIAMKSELDSFKVEDQFKKKLEKFDISGVQVGFNDDKMLARRYSDQTPPKQMPVYMTVMKHNNRVNEMLGEAKKISTDTKAKWKEVEPQLILPEKLISKEIGSDPQAAANILLVLISHFSKLNHKLAEVVDLKNRINDNQMKLGVIKELLDDQNPNAEEQLTTPVRERLSSEDEKEQIDITAEIETLETQQGSYKQQFDRLELDLKNTRLRNTMLEKELKKNSDIVSTAKRENLDGQISDLQSQMSDIQSELQLMSS